MTEVMEQQDVRFTAAEQKKVRAAVEKKYPSLK